MWRGGLRAWTSEGTWARAKATALDEGGGNGASGDEASAAYTPYVPMVNVDGE